MPPIIRPQQLNPEDPQPLASRDQKADVSPSDATSSSSSPIKTLGNKLVLGGAAAAITAIVSVGGLSFAAPLVTMQRLQMKTLVYNTIGISTLRTEVSA